MKTIIEMPEPDGMDVDDTCYYTADQMREYAALVRADEREACMKEADKLRNRFAHLLRPPIVLAVGCFLFAYIVGWV